MTAEQRWDYAFELGPDYRSFGQDWEWGNFPPYHTIQIFTGKIGVMCLKTVIHEGDN